MPVNPSPFLEMDGSVEVRNAAIVSKASARWAWYSAGKRQVTDSNRSREVKTSSCWVMVIEFPVRLFPRSRTSDCWPPLHTTRQARGPAPTITNPEIRPFQFPLPGQYCLHPPPTDHPAPVSRSHRKPGAPARIGNLVLPNKRFSAGALNQDADPPRNGSPRFRTAAHDHQKCRAARRSLLFPRRVSCKLLEGNELKLLSAGFQARHLGGVKRRRDVRHGPRLLLPVS